jgi:uracil-DNA glycosylase
MSLMGLGRCRSEEEEAAAAEKELHEPNVTYMEYEFRESDWSYEEMKLVPSVHYSTQNMNEERIIKSMVLVALRDIDCGEELLSSYLST